MGENHLKQSPTAGEFADGRLWFQKRGSVLTIGMTSQAIEGLGALQAIDLPDEGEEVQQGDVLTTLEGSDGSLEVVAPVTGVVHEINEAVQEEPEIAADDPLEEGWLIKIEIEDASGLAEIQ